MSQDIIKTDEYRNLIANLKNRIQAAQIKAAAFSKNFSSGFM